MNNEKEKLLLRKRYSDVILPFDELTDEIDRKHINHLIWELADIFDFMLLNDPTNEYTIIAAVNLFQIGLCFENKSLYSASKNYLLNSLPPNETYFLLNHPKQPKAPFLSDDIFVKSKDLPVKFKNLLEAFSKAEIESDLIDIYNTDFLYLSGNYYLAGRIAEQFRNHLISKQCVVKWLDYAIPILINSNYMTCSLSALKNNDLNMELRLFPNTYYNPIYRVSSILSVIYGYFMGDRRSKARKYFNLLIRSKQIYDICPNVFSVFHQIFFPLAPSIDTDASYEHINDSMLLSDRFRLSLANEFIIDGNGYAALDTLSFFNFDKSLYINEIFFAEIAEYWALKADAYGLLDMPDKQKEAQRKWLSFWSDSMKFQKTQEIFDL